MSHSNFSSPPYWRPVKMAGEHELTAKTSNLDPNQAHSINMSDDAMYIGLNYRLLIKLIPTSEKFIHHIVSAFPFPSLGSFHRRRMKKLTIYTQSRNFQQSRTQPTRLSQLFFNARSHVLLNLCNFFFLFSGHKILRSRSTIRQRKLPQKM